MICELFIFRERNKIIHQNELLTRRTATTFSFSSIHSRFPHPKFNLFNPSLARLVQNMWYICAPKLFLCASGGNMDVANSKKC